MPTDTKSAKKCEIQTALGQNTYKFKMAATLCENQVFDDLV